MITILIIVAIPQVIFVGYLLHKVLMLLMKLKCFQQLAAMMPSIFKRKRESELIEIIESLPDRIDNPYGDEKMLIPTDE